MRCLYIDTSSSYLYTAIVEDNKVISEIKEDFGHRLSEMALPKIVSMFEENDIQAKEIDKIIVVDGPGSFTGIRIGITIAKVYAWSLKTPITTITSLDAMAVSSDVDNYKVPMLDARRGYVFTAIYDKDNNRVLEPTYIKKEEIDKKLEEIKDFTVITNDKIEGYKNMESYSPNYLKIVEKYYNKENMNPHAVNPNYLKLTEAEESKL